MGDYELRDQLRQLGRELSVQVPDDLPDRVLTEIAAASAGRGTAFLPRRRRWPTALAALLVAAGAAVGVSAPVRAALVDVFGFGPVEVRREPGPAPAPSPVLPGEHRTDVAGAEAEVGFRIRLPSALGEPRYVTVAEGRVVSLHYTGADGPIRIDEFPGDLGVMWEKYVQSAAEPTTVAGREAVWFEQPVALVYVDANGVERTESTRLTGGSLVWMDDGLTFRLDGIRSLEAALTVANSIG